MPIVVDTSNAHNRPFPLIHNTGKFEQGDIQMFWGDGLRFLALFGPVVS
jgi:hypothetical protein